MDPEEHARQHIDQLLQAARWVIQDNKEFNLGAGGVAIRDFSVTTGTVDYA
jgi:type I restriction enzyme R subunit